MKYAKFLQENQYKFKPQLNFDELKDITTQYGCSVDVPISTPIQEPPSPKGSIQKAGEHLIKQQKKGFFPSKEPLVANKIYQSNMIPYILKKRESLKQKQVKFSSSQLAPLNSDNSLDTKNEKPKNQAKSESIEHYQFWHTSKCVNTLISEIQSFPWFDHQQLILAKGKIHDEVSSIVRIMGSKQDISFRGKSRQKLFEIMKEFVLSVREMRKNLIASIIKEEKIDISKLDPKYKTEFSDIFETPKEKPKIPKQSRQKDEDFDEYFLRFVEHMLQNLPKEYRMSTDSLQNYLPHQVQKGKPKILHIDSILSAAHANKSKPVARTQPVSPRDIPGIPNRKRIQTKIIAQPFTRQNSPRQNLEQADDPLAELPFAPEDWEDHKDTVLPYYWNLTDPLKETREGDKTSHSLSSLSGFSKKLGFDHSKLHIDRIEVSDPFHLTIDDQLVGNESKNVDEVPAKQDSVKTEEEDIPQEQIQNEEKTKESNLENLQEITKREIDLFSKRYHFGAKDENYAENEKALLFLEHQNLEVTEDQIGVNLHQRLNEIWDELGFSPMQKLEMVVRYSSSPDNCNKLAEALSLWEMGLSSIKTYKAMYKNFKNFVKYEYNPEIQKYSFVNAENQLIEQVEKLKSIDSQLRKTYNDSLILKRKSIEDVFQSHRLKIHHLKNLKDSQSLFS